MFHTLYYIYNIYIFFFESQGRKGGYAASLQTKWFGLPTDLLAVFVLAICFPFSQFYSQHTVNCKPCFTCDILCRFCMFLLYVTWTMQLFIFSGQGAAPPPWSWRGASSETRVFGTSTRWEALTVAPWPPWSWFDLLRVAQLQVWGTHSWWSPRDVRYTELDVLGVHFAIGGLTGIHTHTHTHTHTRWWQSSQGPRPGFPGLGGGRPFARFPEAIQMLGLVLFCNCVFEPCGVLRWSAAIMTWTHVVLADGYAVQ